MEEQETDTTLVRTAHALTLAGAAGFLASAAAFVYHALYTTAFSMVGMGAAFVVHAALIRDDGEYRTPWRLIAQSVISVMPIVLAVWLLFFW